MQNESSFLLFSPSGKSVEPKPLGLILEDNDNSAYKIPTARSIFSNRRLFDDLEDDSIFNNKENVQPIAVNTELCDIPDLHFTESPVFFSRYYLHYLLLGKWKSKMSASLILICVIINTKVFEESLNLCLVFLHPI